MKNSSARLNQTLRMRHMTMISLGGVIGAGLFVGSGTVIHQIGPASFVSYAIAGVLVVFIMRMLGEMAVARPTTGSFSAYARTSLGNWAGFSVGWLYWYFWVIVVAVEATGGAATLQILLQELGKTTHVGLLTHIPLWVFSLVLLIALTATNLTSVRSYGEFEYWFSLIKVVAIVLFLILGALFVLGLWPHAHLNFSNLTMHQGFFPHGWLALFSGVTTLIFSFVGSEIVTIAAAESSAPKASVAKATSSVIWRVLLFYVGSIFLIVTIVPWNHLNPTESPYVAALQTVHIPFAGVIMNLIVLTAVLSCLNSGLYTASRMLFTLAEQGDAPQWFVSVNRRGVPVFAILLCTVVGYISVVLDYISPNGVFQFLLNSSGAVALFIYFSICLSELRLRRKIAKTSPEDLRLKMWLYPYLTIFVGLLIVVVLAAMAFQPAQRDDLWFSLISLAVVLVLYWIKRSVTSKA